MSLIVGKIVGRNIYIESDSKVTDQNLVRNNPLCGILKTLILHPFVCISFAGNIYFAEEVFKVLFEKMVKVNWNINLLLQMLLMAHRNSNQKTDFAVASIIGKQPSLFKISNGEIQSNILNFWLGDQQGFEFYQQAFHTIEERLPTEEKMRKAFKKVIDQEKITTIGDFHISTHLDYKINPSHPVFLYRIKTEVIVSEPQFIKFEKKDEWRTIPIGTAAGGSYSISYLTTVNPKFHGVAMHFLHGNFGIIFCPQLTIQNGIVINDVNGVEFITEIKKRYGIPLQGLITRSDGGIQYIDNR